MIMDIHRCRFVPYQPRAINALAFSHPSAPHSSSKEQRDLRLAVGRSNGNIEIWNPQKGGWYQENTIRGGKDRSIEGLVWIQDPDDIDRNGYKTPGKLRLFSIGYSTAVTEWDLASGKPARHSAGNYGEIWCMAAQPKWSLNTETMPGTLGLTARETEDQVQNIAVGCADGSLILLSTGDGDLQFSKTIARAPKKKARVLSIAFQNRYTVVAGHADSTIRIYDIRNGNKRNMTLGAGPKGGPRETLVWSVRTTSDGTIVSGDSTGTVCFWDGKIHTLLQRIKSHEADILDVAVSADGLSAFSSGMDRRTTLYRKTGSGRPGDKLRWAKITHQRFHRHDVKAMATFETKAFSVLASGGLDTIPIIIPIQEFGRENHRALSNLPQQPIVQSSFRRRLILSWWDCELRIWEIQRHQGGGIALGISPEPESIQGRKLVAKIALQGEESITAAELSANGDILAVATMAELKLFHLKRKLGNLKLQKIDLPTEIASVGAKTVHISPDGRWIAAIRANDSIQLYRFREISTLKKSLQLLGSGVNLRRLARDTFNRKQKSESLGNYNRSINRIAFSADSRILATTDISGYLDTWILIGHEDLTQDSGEDLQNIRGGRQVDDQDSSGNSEEEDGNVIYGQHWIRNPSASMLIKLPATPLVLSFRPSIRHARPRYSPDLSTSEDRLVIITAENQFYEFNVLSGKISDWSRRNPPLSLPRTFRDQRDRAMGVLWDINGHNERIWLYAVSWLWMLDLSKDLPSWDDNESPKLSAYDKGEQKQHKRRRDHTSKDDIASKRPRRDTGAGSKISQSELRLGVGPQIRRINGSDIANGEKVSLNHEQELLSDEETGYALANENELALMSLRRSNGDSLHLLNGNGGGDEMTNPKAGNVIRGAKMSDDERPSYWSTFKYRPILGIVPLGSDTDDEAMAVVEAGVDQPAAKSLEVALVERPLWDIDLPPRYYGNQEWDP